MNEQIIIVLGLLLNWVTMSGGAVAIIQKIKTLLGWDGWKAHLLSVIVTGVIAVIGAIVAGDITPDLFADPINGIIVVILIFLGTNGIYRQVKYRK